MQLVCHVVVRSCSLVDRAIARIKRPYSSCAFARTPACLLIRRPPAHLRPPTHMLPVSLKMLLPPSPRPLSSLDELDPLLSDPLLDPDPDPFELPGIIRP